MLQTSPQASHISAPIFAASMPSILEAMIMPDFLLQRMLITPHICPAKPTMEVISIDSPAAGLAAVNLHPSISSNTSRAATSSNAPQFSRVLGSPARSSLVVFKPSPPTPAEHAPGPARG